jgi:PAS domain S-box-containing protein
MTGRADGDDLETREPGDPFRLLIDAVKDYAIFLIDPGGRVSSWNSGARALKGYEAGDILGEPFAVFYTKEDRAAGKPEHALRTAAAEGRYEDEGWRLRKDGSLFWANVIVTAVRDGGDSLVGFAKVTRDLTERRRMEDALRQSEKSLSTTLASIGDAVIAADIRGRLTRINPVAETLTGWTAADAIGQSIEDVFRAVHEQTRQPVESPIQSARRQATVFGFANHAVLQSRRRGDVAVAYNAAPIRASAGDIEGVVIVFRDMTSERSAERKLRHAEAMFRSLLEFAPDATVVVDAKGRISLVNAQTERIFRYDRAELIGSPFEVLIAPQFRGAPRAHGEKFSAFATLTPTGAARELLGRRRDGTDFPIELSLSPVDTPDGRLWVLAMRDVSERSRAQEALRRAEHELRQAHKLEAVGRLAGGIAHEFNNLLSVVLTHSLLLAERFSQDGPTRRSLGNITKASERGALLTRQLLAFSREQALEPKPVDLNAIVIRVEKVVRPLLGERISLVVRTAPGLPTIHVDSSQVEQALVNLLVNARDAMQAGGRLTIETAVLPFDSNPAPSALAHAHTYVTVTVCDTGVGMDLATSERIFDPFFTTKPFGTGLGLSIVRGVVEQSGGHIRVTTEPGQGTKFVAYFPSLAAVLREPAP